MVNPALDFRPKFLLSLLSLCIITTLTGQTAPLQYFGERTAFPNFGSATRSAAGEITGLIELDFNDYYFKMNGAGELTSVTPLSNFENNLNLNSYHVAPYGDEIFALGYNGISLNNGPARISSLVFTETGRTNPLCPSYEGYAVAIGGDSRFDMLNDSTYIKLLGPSQGSSDDIILDIVTPNSENSSGPWAFCDREVIGQATPNDFFILSDTIVLVNQSTNNLNRPTYSRPTFEYTVLNGSSPGFSTIDFTERLPALDSFFIEAANPDGINDSGLIYVEGMRAGEVFRYFVDLNAGRTYPLQSRDRTSAHLESDSTIVSFSWNIVYRHYHQGNTVQLFESTSQILQVLISRDPTVPVIIFQRARVISVNPDATVNWDKNVFGTRPVQGNFVTSEMFAGNDQAFVTQFRSDSAYTIHYRTLSTTGTTVVDSTSQHVWLPRTYWAKETSLLQLEYHETDADENIYITNREFTYSGSIENEQSYILAKPPGTGSGEPRGYIEEDKSIFVYFDDGAQNQAYLFNFINGEYITELLPHSIVSNDSILRASEIQISGNYIAIGQLVGIPNAPELFMRLIIVDKITKAKISSKEIALPNEYIFGGELFLNPRDNPSDRFIQLLTARTTTTGNVSATSLIYDSTTDEILETRLNIPIPVGVTSDAPFLGRPGQKSAVFCLDTSCYELDFDGTELQFQRHDFSLPVGHKLISGIASEDQLYVLGDLTPESILSRGKFYTNRAITPIVSGNSTPRSNPETITIYPSPTNGDITIAIEHPAKTQTYISVIDIMGKVKREDIFPQGSQTHHIRLENLTPGLYLVQVGNARSWIMVEE